MRKLPNRKLLSALIAGALFLPSRAFTLGLGEIEVNSALNQTLKADIELLSATPEDAENIIVKLASRDEFQRAGLDRPYSLSDLRFKSEVRDGSPYIVVSSRTPIREPFLNFLLEVDWPNGHLLREYTVLLDPPVFMMQSAGGAATSATEDDNSFRPDSRGVTNTAAVAAPTVRINSRPSASQLQTPSESVQQQAPATSTFVPAPVQQQQAVINQPAGAYRIKAGDTAWSLADAMRPDRSVSVEQMMIAMLRSNPGAFINDNINGLKRGYILRVPDYNKIASVNPSDARALVKKQAALWKQYQQSQAGGQPVSAMKAGDSAASSKAGSDSKMTDDAYLEIVSAGSGASTSSSKDPTKMSAKELRAELALARERVETERVEKEALQGRVNNLEQHVDKMKGMLSIEDDELAEVQSLNQPTDDQSAEILAQEGLQEKDLENALADEAAEVTEEIIDTETTELSDTAESEMAGENVPAEDVLAGTEEAVFADEVGAEQLSDNLTDENLTDESVAGMPEQVDDATENFDAVAPPVVTPEPVGMLDKWLNNPIMLAAGAGGLLFIAGIIGFIFKRRKAGAADAPSDVDNGLDDLESFADELASTAESDNDDVVDALAKDVETETDDGFDSESTTNLDASDMGLADAEPEAADAEDDEPRDDVLAEADVYLAYGIYQQAEDLLTQAITDNPERNDYRVKLAETHYASKNTEAFVEVASELHKQVDNDASPAWKKVMVMGQDMCADNPLFQGSMVGGLDVSSLAPSTPEMDFDLGLDSVDEGGVSDLDLSLDDDALELPEMSETQSTEPDLESTQMLDAEPEDELEFDLSDTGAVEALVTDVEDDFSLDIDATELDIDKAEESLDLEDVDLGLDLSADESATDADEVDLDFGLDDTATSVEETVDEEEISLDLTDVESLDMDLDDAAAPAPESVPLSSMPDDEAEFDLSNLDDVDEISTKLDLARAYLDMGDHDGTRGILEEVLAEGNDEQKQEANDLMEKLD